MLWNLKRYASYVALSEADKKEMTYGELYDLQNKAVDIFSSKCLTFILCSNCISSAAAYVITINNGSVPLLINYKAEFSQIKSLLECYKPRYIWLPKGRRNEFSNMGIVCELEDYYLLQTNYKEEYKINKELALLMSTSGSTGSPKMVRQSYINMLANIKSITEYLELDRNERPITTLPMNYTYGLSIINSHLSVGAEIIMTEKHFMQREFWDLLKQKGATSFGGVPYTYQMLDTIKFYGFDIPGIKTITQAGGKLNTALHRKMAQYGADNNVRFVVMYGQTEATARMSYLPYERSAEKIGSIGIPIPGGKFSLIDENGQEFDEPDRTGELIYIGKNVTMGYAESYNDLVKGDERNNILETGDLAKKDSDGYYYIVGRKKRFLKVFGNRVNLDELEVLVKNKYDMVEACVYGLDDNIIVFTTDIGRMKGIDYYLSEFTGINRSAFHLKQITKIPVNESGKVIYSKLNQHIEL